MARLGRATIRRLSKPAGSNFPFAYAAFISRAGKPSRIFMRLGRDSGDHEHPYCFSRSRRLLCALRPHYEACRDRGGSRPADICKRAELDIEPRATLAVADYPTLPSDPSAAAYHYTIPISLPRRPPRIPMPFERSSQDHERISSHLCRPDHLPCDQRPRLQTGLDHGRGYAGLVY